MRQPVNISRFNVYDLIQYNMDQYHLCKNDDTRIQYSDDTSNVTSSHGYFIISIEWMSVWRHFVNGKGPVPGEIDNHSLKKKIQEARIFNKFPEDE